MTIKDRIKEEWAIVRELKHIINDTLKKEGKYSRTSLTMASAWFMCCFTYMADYFRNGFRMEAFIVMVGVALGSKISDALSTRLNK